MRKLLVAAIVAGCAAAVLQLAAAPMSEAQTPAQQAAPAGAQAAIGAWARARHGDLVFDPIEIFYGDFTGDGAADAMAWIYFSSGGNSASLDVALFRNVGGRMTYLRSEDAVYGETPRNVRFAPGRITLTTTMPRPGDPRCCPTGSQSWTITVR
ncbi:MAG: hypothetical protein NW203_03405 [Hyphomonadaceae bacterium]|nr:hypothetical protein [Hyphomonadaceae bacterium]